MIDNITNQWLKYSQLSDSHILFILDDKCPPVEYNVADIFYGPPHQRSVRICSFLSPLTLVDHPFSRGSYAKQISTTAFSTSRTNIQFSDLIYVGQYYTNEYNEWNAITVKSSAWWRYSLTLRSLARTEIFTSQLTWTARLTDLNDLQSLVHLYVPIQIELFLWRKIEESHDIRAHLTSIGFIYFSSFL